MKFTEKLKILCRGKGVRNQNELAKLLDVSPQLVSNWIKGLNAPNIHQAVEIARCCDVPVGWLIDPTDTREASQARSEAALLRRVAGWNEADLAVALERASRVGTVELVDPQSVERSAERKSSA